MQNNQKKKSIGIIPARYKSSRFNGKPLSLINGVPMIKRTYLQAKKSKKLDDLLVATDDMKIYDFCKSEDIPVQMTSEDCLTGTDRVAEIARSLDYGLYVNIQGDEPIIDPIAIDQIVNMYHTHGSEFMAYNLFKVMDNMHDVNNKAIIKAIVDEYDNLMYMSRLPIPFTNTGLVQKFKQQVPVYGFTRKGLDIFSSYGRTINEQFEDIELLRFVDLGYKVKMQETFANSIAVDYQVDIKKVEDFLNSKKQKNAQL